MNLLHGLSYLRLLDGRETTLVYGTRYSSAFNISWAPRGDHFLVQEISDLIQGFACNCCVDVVCRFKLLFTLARVLRSQSISDRNSFIDFLSFILIFKTAKDKILEHVADRFCFPSSMCGDQSPPPPPPPQMGGQTLKFDYQNFKFWLAWSRLSVVVDVWKKKATERNNSHSLFLRSSPTTGSLKQAKFWLAR